MKYLSTRGGSSGLSFEEAVLAGLSPDGGLYIPADPLPRFPLRTVLGWHALSYADLAFEIFRPFITQAEMPDADLRELLRRSFATFSHADVTPVVPLPKADGNGKFYVLELFHGPTYAFKDVALQVLGNLFEYFLARKNAQAGAGHEEHAIKVLGATSGDTGGAAIYGLRGKKHVKLFILHPKGRISDVQEAQMTTVNDANVFNVAIEGVFDDCQDVVKMLFSDAEYREKHKLGAINSINWARILAQTSYYYASYFLLLRNLGVDLGALLADQTKSDADVLAALPRAVYSVPTGNFGDILAGYYSVRTGLPNVSKLLIATNENDILHRFLETGTYNKRAAPEGGVEPAKATLSPAMDILVSSNFERLLWYLERGDQVGADEPSEGAERASQAVLNHMKSLNTTGGFTVSPDVLARCQALFASRCVSNAETAEAIKRYFQTTGGKYILDPHTAVGVVAAEQYGSAGGLDGAECLVLATAHPAKFPEAVLEACEGVKYEDFAPKPMVEFLSMPRRCVTAWTKGGDKMEAEKAVRKIMEDEGQGKDVFAAEYGVKA